MVVSLGSLHPTSVVKLIPSKRLALESYSRTDHVSNEEVYDRTGTVSFSQSLKALQVRFLGHCLRHRQGDQIHFEYTSNQDLVDVISISLVCCKANQSCKPPVRQEIRPLAQDRKTWKSMEVD